MNTTCNATDWHPAPGNLDEAWAKNTLAGLSKEAAISILEINPTTYTEAISHSKGACFQFHLDILLDFLLSHRSGENFAAAYAFMSIISSSTEVCCVSDEFLSKISVGGKLVSENQMLYDADIDIYGSFHDLYSEFLRKHHSGNLGGG
jgi:hypothetical protein